MNTADARAVDDTIAGQRWRFNPENELYETLRTTNRGPRIVDRAKVLALLPEVSDSELTIYENIKWLEWIKAGLPALGGVELPD